MRIKYVFFQRNDFFLLENTIFAALFNDRIQIMKTLSTRRSFRLIVACTVLSICTNVFSQTTEEVDLERAQSLIEFADTLMLKDDYKSAEKCLLEALIIREKVLGKEHIDYVISLSNLGGLYIDMCDYAQAEKYYLEAKNIVEKVSGKEHRYYAIALQNLGYLYCFLSDYAQAEKYYLEAKNVIENVSGKEHLDYVFLMSTLGELYRELGDEEQSERFFQEARDFWGKEVLRENSNNERFNFESRLDSLITHNYNIGDYAQAEKYFLELDSLYEKNLNYFDKMDYNYVKSQDSISRTYFEKGDYKKMLKCEQNIVQVYERNLRNRIAYMSEEQLILFGENNFLDDRLSLIYSLLWNYPKKETIELSYRYTLLSKLFLLNSIKSIRSEEFNLVNYSEKYTIQQYLGKNEVVIDFFNFNLIGKQGASDSNMYGAFLLRKNYAHPRFIPLFNENVLKKLLSEKHGNNKQDSIGNLYKQNGYPLYHLIWQPIERFLTKKDTIYYSLSGLLNRISFPAIQTKSNNLLDRFDMRLISCSHEIISQKNEIMFTELQKYLDVFYMLKILPNEIDARKQMLPSDASYLLKDFKSNFRQIIKELNIEFDIEDIKAIPFNSAVCYGDIIYSVFDQKNLIEAVNQAKPTQTKNFASIFVSDMRTRSSWGPLPETANEVNQIEQLLNKLEISYKKYMGVQATEESIKQLSGNSPELLHIATHGFFYEDEEKIKNNKFMQSMNMNSDNYVFQNPLLRSGLLFAGSNRAWEQKDVISGIEDGILTAEEIAHLDLSKTKLVVLSACETGLGEVKNSEGVFGLQRAFKIAGVKTLVMSLWKVDDRATKEFMIAFYQALFSGKSKHESFKNAQQAVRGQEEFKNPYFWAGFVMMD